MKEDKAALMIAIGSPKKGAMGKGMGHGPDADDTGDAEESDPGLESAAEDMVSALGLDPKQVKMSSFISAFKRAHEMCMDSGDEG